MKRRAFLGAGASCTAQLFAWAALAPVSRRALFAARSTYESVTQETWGRIEQIAENVWALISTPLTGGENAMRTISNGGIIAGRQGLVVVEGFGSNDGAQWMAEAARKLTRRDPTHVVLTHYHGDHSAGLAGYLQPGAAPTYVSAGATVAKLRDSASNSLCGSPSSARWSPAHSWTMPRCASIWVTRRSS